MSNVWIPNTLTHIHTNSHIQLNSIRCSSRQCANICILRHRYQRHVHIHKYIQTHSLVRTCLSTIVDIANINTNNWQRYWQRERERWGEGYQDSLLWLTHRPFEDIYELAIWLGAHRQKKLLNQKLSDDLFQPEAVVEAAYIVNQHNRCNQQRTIQSASTVWMTTQYPNMIGTKKKSPRAVCSYSLE